MTLIPTLLTERLRLRGFTPADAPELTSLLANGEVASRMPGIPRPYGLGNATDYIQALDGRFMAGDGPVWAVCRRDDAALLGSVSLSVDVRDRRAGLYFWLGRPYRYNGYATEAGFAALYFGFKKLKLRRVDGWHLGSNPAAGKVLQKLGMALEASRRDHILKDGRYEDVLCHAILREEYDAASLVGGRFVVLVPKDRPQTVEAPS